VEIEVSGGLELLFEEHRRLHHIEIEVVSLKELILFIKNKLIKERIELFYNEKDGSVRPGILVLVNDMDWELCDGLEYLVQDGDKIAFISTLHGG